MSAQVVRLETDRDKLFEEWHRRMMELMSVAGADDVAGCVAAHHAFWIKFCGVAGVKEADERERQSCIIRIALRKQRLGA